MMAFLGRLFDERFLMHRLRSTSIGGIAAATLALLLFAYHFYFQHVWNWELLAIGITAAVVKWALMTWYLATN